MNNAITHPAIVPGGKTPTARLLLLLVVWGFVVSLAGAFQLLSHLPPRVPPLLIVSLTVGFSIAVATVDWLKAAAAQLGVRGILSLHLVRFIGFYFLWLHAQGRLPAEFAERAGWGDIVAAVGAVVLLSWPEGVGFRRALLAWTAFGIFDLLVALGTAGWLTITRPDSMIEVTKLPLTLVPLWIVPILLASHIYLMRMQRRATASFVGR